MSKNENERSNKPDNSQFKQQRLPAWQPVMSPPHVVGCFAVIVAIFIPIGIAIINGNSRAFDEDWKYTTVNGAPAYVYNQTGTGCGIQTVTYTENGVTRTASQGCRRVVDFTLTETLEAPVYLYYKLTNFYQNHRRFAKSRNNQQIAGQSVSASAASDCAPFIHPSGSGSAFVDGSSQDIGSMIYAPCGLVAWSMFNDTFTLVKKNASGGPVGTLICNGTDFSRLDNEPLNQSITPNHCTKSKITWESDKEKFQIPTFASDIWTGSRTEYGAPALNTTDPFLAAGWYSNEPGHPVPLLTDTDTMVWMRTASLPTFRKLYRIIEVDLPAGNYSMIIDEYFPSDQYGGEKRFALSTISWVGGKNHFLGIAYTVVGGIALILAIVFIIVHRCGGDRTQQAIESLNELQ